MGLDNAKLRAFIAERQAYVPGTEYNMHEKRRTAVLLLEKKARTFRVHWYHPMETQDIWKLSRASHPRKHLARPCGGLPGALEQHRVCEHKSGTYNPSRCSLTGGERPQRTTLASSPLCAPRRSGLAQPVLEQRLDKTSQVVLPHVPSRGSLAQRRARSLFAMQKKRVWHLKKTNVFAGATNEAKGGLFFSCACFVCQSRLKQKYRHAKYALCHTNEEKG